MVEEIPGLKGFVARQLLAEPEPSVREIKDAALARYPDVADLTTQEFSARYVLPLKRWAKRGAPRRPPPAVNGNGERGRPASEAPPPRPTPGTLVPPAPPRADGETVPLLDAAIAFRRRTETGAAPPAGDGGGTGGGAKAASREEGTRGRPGYASARDARDARDVRDPGDARAAGHDESPPAPGDGAAAPERPAAGDEPAGSPSGAKARERGRGSRATRASRADVRVLFLKLALELESAETDAEWVDVIARLDRYVDEMLRMAA